MTERLVDGRLNAYLLGRLSPEEEDAVEMEYLGAADAFDRLEAAEDDLIDAYVAGRLAADDAARFEERFLASPRHRERVAFARALRTLAAAKAERPAPRRASWLLPLAAALPVALAGGLFLTVRDLRIEVTRQREAESAREHESAGDRARIASLERELARDRPASGIVAWRLAPGFERDEPAPAPLTVPANAAHVRLQLSLPPGAGQGPFVARMETAEGQLVAEVHGLKTREGDPPAVEMIVPSASLRPGTYVVIVRGGRPRNVVDTYRLRVGAP